MLHRKTTLRVSLMAVGWLVSIGAGLGYLQKYANAPTPAGSPPRHWPANSHLTIDSTKATLLVFAHPRCPCTRATLGELALLMARCQGKIRAEVIFFQPRDQKNEWAQTDLWRGASAIPDVTSWLDKGGTEARIFQVQSSGHTLLFDARGNLLFSGGITSSRGHSGDNAGRSAIVNQVMGWPSSVHKTPVFGCSLLDPDESSGKPMRSRNGI